MSIYATQWVLKFPADGFGRLDRDDESDWVTVIAQGVPPHIDYVGPDWEFLPPPVSESPDALRLRAVVFVRVWTPKGTDRNGQEYVSPLMTITGDEYATLPFDELYRRLSDAIRGDRPAVAVVVYGPDGKRTAVYKDGSRDSLP